MQEKAPAAARHFFVRGQNKRRVVDARQLERTAGYEQGLRAIRQLFADGIKAVFGKMTI